MVHSCHVDLPYLDLPGVWNFCRFCICLWWKGAHFTHLEDPLMVYLVWYTYINIYLYVWYIHGYSWYIHSIFTLNFMATCWLFHKNLQQVNIQRSWEIRSRVFLIWLPVGSMYGMFTHTSLIFLNSRKNDVIQLGVAIINPYMFGRKSSWNLTGVRFHHPFIF